MEVVGHLGKKVKTLPHEGKKAILAELVGGTVQAGTIAEKGASAGMVYMPVTR